MKIWVRELTLSDGSPVYDVFMDSLRLHAVTYNDAKELCAKLAEAIESHTTMKVDSDH